MLIYIALERQTVPTDIFINKSNNMVVILFVEICNMDNEKIFLKLEEIENHLLGSKKILNVEELSRYTGFRPSYIYKLVHRKILPFSKPNGKLLFFDREKIDSWLLRNPSFSIEQIQNELVQKILKDK